MLTCLEHLIMISPWVLWMIMICFSFCVSPVFVIFDNVLCDKDVILYVLFIIFVPLSYNIYNRKFSKGLYHDFLYSYIIIFVMRKLSWDKMRKLSRDKSRNYLGTKLGQNQEIILPGEKQIRIILGRKLPCDKMRKLPCDKMRNLSWDKM